MTSFSLVKSLCASEDSCDISISISFLLVLMLMFNEDIVGISIKCQHVVTGHYSDINININKNININININKNVNINISIRRTKVLICL